jgi:catechol 2,3-dioxygenase-like lactoylglutathione lyase family enzyme
LSAVSSPFVAVNHVGYVVRDIEEGLRFFTEVLGFEAVEGRRGEVLPKDDLLTRRFGVDASASGKWAFLRLDDDFVELLEWSAPNRNEAPPLNSDLGGRHIALTVSDMDAAVARLKAAGVTVREPNDAGYIYCATPLGLEIQLIPT